MHKITIKWLMLAMAGLASQAGAAPAGNSPPDRIRSVATDAAGRCPPSTETEVVVCHPRDDPYRIPKPLRHTEIAAADQSWVNRTATMDEVGRAAAGLPDTCSPVGTGGQSGCAMAAMHAWAAERRAIRREAEAVP